MKKMKRTRTEFSWRSTKKGKNMLSKKILQIVDEAVVDQYVDMGNWLRDLKFKSVDIHPCFSEYEYFMRHYRRSVEVIKKPVPIAWYLKGVLICMCLEMLDDREHFLEDEKYKDVPLEEKNLVLKEVGKRLQRYLRERNVVYDDISAYTRSLKDIGYTFPRIREEMEHYFRYSNPKIKAAVEGYDYGKKHPVIVFRDLGEIVESLIDPNESFYLDESEEYDEAENSYKIEDYLVFPDGWKWVWKHTYGSEVEHKYASNCGRCSERSEELLSLREPISKGKWKIRATFSINPEGYLVQRKGVTETYKPGTNIIKSRDGNTRPKEDIHPYIYELIKYGMSRKDIVGFNSRGSYRPDQDFQLEDLPKEQEEEILLKGFEIVNEFDYMYEEYDHFGKITESMLERINEMFNSEMDESLTIADFNFDESNESENEWYFDNVSSIFNGKSRISDGLQDIHEAYEFLSRVVEDGDSVEDEFRYAFEDSGEAVLEKIYSHLDNKTVMNVFGFYVKDFEEALEEADGERFFEFLTIVDRFLGYSDLLRSFLEAMIVLQEDSSWDFPCIYVYKGENDYYHAVVGEYEIVDMYDSPPSFVRNCLNPIFQACADKYDRESSSKYRLALMDEFFKIYCTDVLAPALNAEFGSKYDQMEFDGLESRRRDFRKGKV